MNTLPEARRIIHGRTWSSAWRAADADPIEWPADCRRRESAADIALAIAIGVIGALALIHWWAA